MKTMQSLIVAMLMAATTFSLTSCDEEDDEEENIDFRDEVVGTYSNMTMSCYVLTDAGLVAFSDQLIDLAADDITVTKTGSEGLVVAGSNVTAHQLTNGVSFTFNSGCTYEGISMEGYSGVTLVSGTNTYEGVYFSDTEEIRYYFQTSLEDFISMLVMGFTEDMSSDEQDYFSEYLNSYIAENDLDTNGTVVYKFSGYKE